MAARFGHLIRRMSSNVAASEFEIARAAEEVKATGVWTSWKTYSAVMIIGCGAITAKCFIGLEHPENPEFKEYSHMRIRRKPFPFGDGNKTLFHDAHVNALPEGYQH